MQEKISGFVIDIVRHNDRHNVVTLFSRSRGRVAFLSPVGKGSRGAGRAARIAPLAWLDAEVNFRPGRDLQILSGVSLHRVWHRLYFDPLRTPLVIFISDFLNRLLRVSAPDEFTFDYIASFLSFLDSTLHSTANLHLSLLLGLLEFMGISPLLQNLKPGQWLDMRAGLPSDVRPSHPDYLSPSDVVRLPDLMRMQPINAHLFRLTSDQRVYILNNLLKYYQIHLPGILPIKSLPILQSLF
ncbi:MAG: recombination protein O N-terminal domain-containing protein [Muribaculaceae bacterium]|nr:recombination protein O N-terminal domain-containing protein [Muribaculaceae bacterium]